MYEVWIDATVILHKNSKDPGFELDVKKFRENYSSPDKLSFEIQPRKDGNLTIILSEDGSSQLYPNKLERSEKLIGQNVYNFPRSKALITRCQQILNLKSITYSSYTPSKEFHSQKKRLLKMFFVSLLAVTQPRNV